MKLIQAIKKIKYELFFFLIFVIWRIPQLGFDNINTDAPVWKTRTFEFSSAFFSLNFAGTDVTYHPGVVLMWISALGVKIYNLYVDIAYAKLEPSSIRDYVGLDFSQKFLLLLFYGVVLSVTLFILRKLTRISFVFVFFFLLSFEPFLISLTRVLHTDGLVTFLIFGSFISLYFSLVRRNKLVFVLSALFCALSLLTKSNALIFFVFVGGVIGLFNLLNVKKLSNVFKLSAKYYLIWVSFVLAFFIIFWPAMWVDPITTLKEYLFGITNVGLEPHDQEWFGQYVADPGFLYYPVVYFIRSTPYFLLLSISGIVLYIYGYIRYKKHNLLYTLSLLFLLFYTLILTISDKKLGRYILPEFPFFTLFATYFILEFIAKFKFFVSNFKIVIISLCSIFVLLSYVATFRYFPDYFMYYSPVIGGWEVGKMIEEPKWPVGYSTLATYLNQLPGAKDRYILARFGYLYNPWNISKKTGTLSQKTEKDKGSYFIMEKFSDWRYLKGKGVKLHKVIKVGGFDMFWVYEIIGDYEVTKNYQFIFPKGAKVDPRF